MAQTAILFSQATKPFEGSTAWVARAAQARRIAVMLSPEDAKILEAYAVECEAKAARPTGQRPAIAA